MSDVATTSRVIASARPDATAALMDETGLDDEVLRRLVHRFYARVREDALLGRSSPPALATGGRISRRWSRSGPRWR